MYTPFILGSETNTIIGDAINFELTTLANCLWNYLVNGHSKKRQFLKQSSNYIGRLKINVCSMRLLLNSHGNLETAKMMCNLKQYLSLIISACTRQKMKCKYNEITFLTVFVYLHNYRLSAATVSISRDAVNMCAIISLFMNMYKMKYILTLA